MKEKKFYKETPVVAVPPVDLAIIDIEPEETIEVELEESEIVEAVEPEIKSAKLNPEFDDACVEKMKKWLKVTDENVKVTGQVKSMLKFIPNFVAVEWGLGGCELVSKLQAAVGARQTGFLNQETVMAMQRMLIGEGFKIEPHGVFDDETSLAFQVFLNTK